MKQQAENRQQQAEQTQQQAEQRQQQAEQGQQEVEDRQQQVDQRQREAISRSRIAERRLTEETQRRMELEEVNRGLEAQLMEAEHLAQTRSVAERENVFWRVRKMSMAAKLRHPHRVSSSEPPQPASLSSSQSLMSTSLRNVLETGQLQPAHISPISRSVALALNYLHLLRLDPVLHRDVSRANVLLNPSPDDGWLAKLSDYGSANFTRQVSTDGPGNPAYAAPRLPTLVNRLQRWTCTVWECC